MGKKLIGIAASDGYAYAKAYPLVQPDLTIPKETVENVDDEIKRFEEAIDKSKAELEVIRKNAVERSEEHTSELQSRFDLVCRLLLEKKNNEKLSLSIIRDPV